MSHASPRRLSVATCLLLALYLPCTRAELILLPVQTAGVAGDPFRVDLLITNETDGETTFEVPDTLALRLSGTDQASNLSLERDPASPGGRLQLPPNGVRRVAYRGTLPAAMRGPVTLRALDLPATAAMMDIGPSAEPVAQAEAQAAGSGEPAAAAASPPQVPLSREQAFAAALSGYEPVYVAFGVEEGSKTKFQLSFKFRFFNEKAGLAQRVRFLDDLYLGYTQTSVWDLDAPSSPFEDSSYKPRVFYFEPSAWTSSIAPVRLGVETGLGHESNGQGGEESRSINIAYVRPTLVLGRPADWQLTFAPLFNEYLEKKDNPDIQDYRGYVDWYATLGKADSAQLAATYRTGSKGWSVQLDLTYPLSVLALGNLNGYLLFQYFDGWGETILRYNERSEPQYRLGLMFVR
jgi:outer membrane phospholipase A